MSIYTRGGDRGETSLFGGKRVSKTDPHIEATGSIDELTSFIGLTLQHIQNKEEENLLITIQKDLYIIMGLIAGAPEKKDILEHLKNQVNLFEKEIDKVDKELPKLTRFILPGGSVVSSLLHVCRAVCRRAERRMVALELNNIIIRYFNRLSDLLFMLARQEGSKKEIIT